MPNAIIDMPTGPVIDTECPEYEVTVKKNGKTIYHNLTYSVVMNMVQSIDKLTVTDDDFEIDGDSQVFASGHPMIILFALDQMKEKLKKRGVYDASMVWLQKNVDNPKLKDHLREICKKHHIKIKYE